MMRKLQLKAHWIAMAALAILLVPMTMIAKYDQPSADDYIYGIGTNHTWQQTHSLLAVTGSAWNTMIEKWWHWDGDFTSTFLGAFQPEVFGLYGVIPIVIMAFLVLATVWLLWELVVRHLDGRPSQALLLSAVLLIAETQFLPSAVQAFYWYDGAISYTFIYSLCLISYALLLATFRLTGRRRTAAAVAAAVLGFLCAGGNFISTLPSLLILLILAGALYWQRRQIDGPTVAVFLATLAGLVLSTVAPGNFLRASTMVGGPSGPMAMMAAIFNSLKYGAIILFQLWTVPVIVAILLAGGVFALVFWRAGLRRLHPVTLTVLAFGLYCSGYAPLIYALGVRSLNYEARVLNVLYFNSVLFGAVVFGVWGVTLGRWLVRHPQWMTPERKTAGRRLAPAAITAAIVLAVAFIPAAHLTPTSLSAATSLADGSAEAYGQQSLSREMAYANPNIPNVLVKQYTVRPKVLYYDDIKASQTDWRNQAIAQYFGKRSVRLVGISQ